MHFHKVICLAFVLHLFVTTSTSVTLATIDRETKHLTDYSNPQHSMKNKTNVTRSRGWTAFAGCSNMGESNSLQEATNSRVQQVIRQIFNDSIYSFTEEDDIYSCSKHCALNTTAIYFTYFKGICQCMDVLQKMLNTTLNRQNEDCIDTHSCIEFNDGFCANGIGLPIFDLNYNMFNDKDIKLKVPTQNILPHRCLIQTDETDLRPMNQASCKQYMRSLPCSYTKIVFDLESVGFVEWTCVSGNGQQRKYFRISTSYELDVQQQPVGTRDTKLTTVDVHNKDYQENITSNTTHEGSFNRDNYQVIVIGVGIIIILSLCVCNIISLIKNYKSVTINNRYEPNHFYNNQIRENSIEVGEIDDNYNGSDQYEIIDENEMNLYDYALDCDIDSARQECIHPKASHQSQSQQPCASRLIEPKPFKLQRASRPKQPSRSRLNKRALCNQIYLTVVNDESCSRGTNVIDSSWVGQNTSENADVMEAHAFNVYKNEEW